MDDFLLSWFKSTLRFFLFDFVLVVLAQVGKGALAALGISCGTDIAAVKDKPVVGPGDQILRYVFNKLLFSL
jgi:hypothetical protein